MVKIPRFAFQKFKGADPTLTTQMKSVGEVMAIGRTFKESLQKAIRSLELDLNGLVSRLGIDRGVPEGFDRQGALERIRQQLRSPIAERIWYLADGMRLGMPNEELFSLTKIDYWFLDQLRDLVKFEQRLVDQAAKPSSALDNAILWEAKEQGFSDNRIAFLTEWSIAAVHAAESVATVKAVSHRRIA